MSSASTQRSGHTEGNAFGVTSNGIDNSGGLHLGPQICLNGNDSEQLNHTRTTHRPGDHNTPQLRQAGKTHTHTHTHTHDSDSILIIWYFNFSRILFLWIVHSLRHGHPLNVFNMESSFSSLAS